MKGAVYIVSRLEDILFMKKFSLLLILLFPGFGSTGVLPTAEEILLKYDTNQNGNLEYRTEISNVDYIELEKPLRSCMDDFLSDKENLYRTLFVYVSKHQKIPEPIDLAIFHYLTPRFKIVLTKEDVKTGVSLLESCSSLDY